MALTVNVASVDVRARVGGICAQVGLDVEGPVQSNALDSALRRALVWVGLSPASPGTVADADLSTLSGFDVEKYLDAACLYTLEAALGRRGGADQQVGPHMQRLSQVFDQIREMIQMYLTKLMSPYGASSVVSSAVQTGGPTSVPYDVEQCRPWTGRGF